MGQTDKRDVLYIKDFVLPRKGQPIVIRIAISFERTVGASECMHDWLDWL